MSFGVCAVTVVHGYSNVIIDSVAYASPIKHLKFGLMELTLQQPLAITACIALLCSILEELQAAYARTTAVSPYASFKPFSQEEPDEKFAFEWDAKGFEGDFSLEVDPEDLHNTVEGEDNVFEILSGLFKCFVYILLFCLNWSYICLL